MTMRAVFAITLVACVHPPPPLHRDDIPLVQTPAGLPCQSPLPLAQMCECLEPDNTTCNPVKHENGPLRYFAVEDNQGSITTYAAGPRPGGWAVVAEIGRTEGEQELDFQASEVHVIDQHRVVWVNAVWKEGELRSRTTAILCVLGNDRSTTTCPFSSLREVQEGESLRTWAVAMAVNSGVVVVSQASGDPDPQVPTGRFRLW